MKVTFGKRNWRSTLGVVAAGLFACSLQVQGAPPGQTDGAKVSAPPFKRTVPTLPPVQAYSVETVIQREGLGAIPLSLELEGAGYSASTKTLGTCRANSDCDDCDFCTTDVCTVTPPAVVGKCSNAPTSACSSCPDGDFCNGAEICDPGGTPGDNCRAAVPADPCTIPGQTCDPLGGAQNLGDCVDACDDNSDCDDGLECNGVETCVNPGPTGLCRAASLPCGPANACSELFCSTSGVGGGSVGDPCTVDADCGSPGGVCQVGADCNVNGRCCTDSGGGSFLTCARSNKPDCDAASGVWLFAGDDPGTAGDQASCDLPAPSTATNAGETFNCPQYAAGIFTDVDIDSLTPAGQIGAAACNDAQEIGDDYELDIADGEYLEVTTVRMIKGFQQDGIPGSASRVRITFYDEDGNFIEDTITNPEGQGVQGIRTYIYAEKPRIPKRGFIAVRAAVRFSPFGKHTWSGGVAADTTGSNDPTIMWKDGAPALATDVWTALGQDPATPGRMAFEIVGDVISDPSGACCDAVSGSCDLVLPWKCELPRCDVDQNVLCDTDADCVNASAGTSCLVPGFFQGSEAQCQACQNDEFTNCSTPSDCPGCAGIPGFCVDAPGQNPCSVDADCIPFGGTTCTPQPCDPDSDCPGGVCTGGTCVGGSNGGGSCDVDVDCGAGTCSAQAACNPVPPACTLQACCPDTPDGTCVQIGAGDSCPVGYTSRGNGTNCDPNLCQQDYSGSDTCADAALPGNIQVFEVSKLSGCQTETWTVTGNNLGATFNDNPGTCAVGIFNQAGATQDRGWWHAFSIDACANVRMDFCGTTELYGETKQPAWAALYSACDPCSTLVAASVVGGPTEGGCVGTPDSSGDRGSPFCARDDLWETYGPLPAGTYWYPIYSSPTGTFGDYQWHITVSACPRAACCLPEGMCTKVDDSLVFDGGGAVITCADDAGCAALTHCDNDLGKTCSVNGDCPSCVGGPTPDAACTVDADCGAGGTCSGTSTCRAATCNLCANVNTFDCTTAGGKWNGFGSTRVQCPGGICTAGLCVGGADDGFACFGDGELDPITSCDSDPCEIGSCCTGPAECNDRANPGTPCDLTNPVATCISRSDCDGVGGDFKGGAGCLDPIQPCPACTNIGANNCQFPLNGGYGMMSDLDLGRNGTAVADDFIPLGTTIESICVWGTYLDPTGPGQNAGASEEYSCVGTPQGETFRVRIFGNVDDGVPGRSGLPDTSNVIGESLVTGANIVSGPLRNTNYEATYGIIMQEFTLVLNNPITGMSPGTTYWIEVVDYTPEPEGNQCRWHWSQAIPAAGGELGYAAAGISPHTGDPDDVLGRQSVYVNGSAKGGFDMAFCLTTTGGAALDFTTPDDPDGCCWDCVTGGTPQSLMSCVRNGGVWDRNDPTCVELEAPEQPNDFCAPAAPSGSVAAALACGDGVVDPGEQCDDGNTAPDDGCDENCLLECGVDGGGGGLGALKITDGLYRLDNQCANVDGPTLVRGEGGDTALDGDIWYEYTSSCTGIMTVDMCLTQTGWNIDGYTGMDSMLGIYAEIGVTRCEDGTNEGQTCVCPGNPPSANCVDATQCPGGSGVCRNICPCPGAFSGVSPFQAGTGSDEGCNGIADAGAGIQSLTVFPEECYLIRVGAWMTAGAAPGTGNRGRGLMSVACEALDCFPSSPPLLQEFLSSTGTTVPYIKARAISVLGGDAGRSQAIRVTWKSMPPGWESWEGQSLFAGPPVCGSELGGTPWYDDLGCPPGAGELQIAELQCDPHFIDWSGIGVVHLIHEAIPPSKLVSGAGPVDIPALFDIEFVDESCALGVSSSYSDAVETRTAGWGDNSELFAGQSVTPGDKVTVADTLGMVNKFAGVGGPTKAAADMLGVTTGQVPRLDGKITVNDTVATLGAFGGSNYIFTAAAISPPPGACPP